jgi:DNA helicase IV
MNETWWVKPDQLNEEQRDVIQLPKDDSFLITGPPGCGKTNLLLLRANYLVRAGHPNVLILVFNRTLQEFIAAGGAKYAFSAAKVMTSRRWAMKLLREYGIAPPTQGDFERQRTETIAALDKLIENQGLTELYDAILLDEAQDYLPTEIKIFRRVAKRIFAVADANQKIYQGDDPFDALKVAVKEVKALRYHYRCGLKICAFADVIGKEQPGYQLLTATCQYDETAKPSFVGEVVCRSRSEESAAIVKVLETQLKAYPEELLGVICSRRNIMTEVWENIRKSAIGHMAVLQSGEGGYAPFTTAARICVCTVNGAKGLEFRTAHIAGCELLRNIPFVRHMAYMAVTRAKTSLSLYRCGEILGFIESAVASLSPPRPLPRLEDVF